MLLNKRINENDELVCLYESSNIALSFYNKKAQLLKVVFKNGTQYQYNGVDNVNYILFESADSQGKVLNSKIKQFDVVKLSDFGVENIQEMFDEIARINKENFEITLRNKMNDLSSKESFSKQGIIELQAVIAEYLKLD